MDLKRRSFFKGAGIISAVVAAGITPSIVNNHVNALSNKKEDISSLSPESGVTQLSLHGDNRTAKEKQAAQSKNSDSSFAISSFSPSVTTNQVSLAVGKDDRLWMKVGNQWKRVVVEG